MGTLCRVVHAGRTGMLTVVGYDRFGTGRTTIIGPNETATMWVGTVATVNKGMAVAEVVGREGVGEVNNHQNYTNT